MIPLDPVTKTNGHTYTLVKRTPTAAIYRQSGGKGDATAYEVIVINVRDAETIMGREYPAREVYPNMNDWGTLGWTYTGPNGLELAEKKFASIA